MEAISIEKGVPIPPPGAGRGQARYPWDELEIGDSFYVDEDPMVVRGSCGWQQRRYGRTFLVRKEGDGSRVWRTA